MYKNVPLLTKEEEYKEPKIIKKKYHCINICLIILKIPFIYILLFLLRFSSKIDYKNSLVYIYDYPTSTNPQKKLEKKTNMKIALCTIGKQENLYAKEFIEYYINIGVDHLYIYDDNDPNTERISDILEPKYQSKVTIHLTKEKNITHQSMAFDHCYKNYNKKYDWFIMLDMDEFLYTINTTLEEYLSDKIFDKCDIIKINWVVSRDNDLLHYDSRPQFERFKPPYIKFSFIKSIIKGNIPDLTYWVHSPKFSPTRNTTCNNKGDIIKINNDDDLVYEQVIPPNFEKAFIIHFRFRSTEELIIKNKRGFSNWLHDLEFTLNAHIWDYFNQNEITLEKIDYIEKELNLNLWKYRLRYYYSKLFFL